MKIEYHPAVEQDVGEALERHDAISPKLSAEFRDELRRMISAAAKNPSRFHLLKTDFRRANLIRFPYHFIYREIPGGIRIVLVRHHRRHPDFGMKRH